jgi:soluble lytic murein transglycosylase-like protein
VKPIQSGVGAVGLMQVYPRVWRGFYDVSGLETDVGYNGRAGTEILHHYLRDYAIRKGEHTATGDPDNLARASYAVYNGGPGHLRRYRNPNESPSLKAIDTSFYAKYQAVKAGKELTVEGCFTGVQAPGSAP